MVGAWHCGFPFKLGDLVASPLHWPLPQPTMGSTPPPDILIQQARQGPGMCISNMFPVGGDPAPGGVSLTGSRQRGRELGKEIQCMDYPPRPWVGTSPVDLEEVAPVGLVPHLSSWPASLGGLAQGCSCPSLSPCLLSRACSSVCHPENAALFLCPLPATLSLDSASVQSFPSILSPPQ